MAPNACGLCVSTWQELDTGYRKIWDFGRSWDPDAYAAQSRVLGEIRRDLVLQRNWKASLDRMKTNMTVGCLQVGLNSLALSRSAQVRNHDVMVKGVADLACQRPVLCCV